MPGSMNGLLRTQNLPQTHEKTERNPTQDYTQIYAAETADLFSSRFDCAKPEKLSTTVVRLETGKHRRSVSDNDVQSGHVHSDISSASGTE